MRMIDWSSDACSSDLIFASRCVGLRHSLSLWESLLPRSNWFSQAALIFADRLVSHRAQTAVEIRDVPRDTQTTRSDRQSVVYGTRVSVRVDLGGHCIIHN